MAISRPRLTMPRAEAAALRAAYAEARVVLEYGSGGSTLVAAKGAGRVVFSVESDPAWAAMMGDWFASNPPAGKVNLHPVDIGPTKDWGRPADASGAAHWPDYAFSVWEREDFRHPDVVLIDGRFRVACFVATAIGIRRPVTVLFDDYARRAPYHRVERIAAPAGRVGRMALFDLTPGLVADPTADWIMDSFAQPD